MADSSLPPGQNPPQVILDQANAAAASSEPHLPEYTASSSRPTSSSHHKSHRTHPKSNEHKNRNHLNRTNSLIPGADQAYREDLGDVPPPAYDSNRYGKLKISQNGFDTGAKVREDGRVGIKINQRNHKLSNLLGPALRNQLELHKQSTHPLIPALTTGPGDASIPPLNVVIQIVGSRGDVQPFVALGQVLKNQYGHRVRIATHPVFRDFVTENGLEFFSIGGDPSELMAFMVKNPGLMPGMDSLKSGDIGKRRKGIYEMVTGCWRSCIETGDGTGIEASDDILENMSFDSATSVSGSPFSSPFVADAIIANPPSFAHVHIAEKLGIPLHLMFTMPWSPTQAFPHPLASITSSNADATMTNFISYALVDMMTWQGLGDVINRFREKSLGLEPVSIMWAPGMTSRLRIPYTYCWSPALIPKPKDWGDYIDISGFYFLNLATNFNPPEDLAAFLDSGPPPVYIGFGSIVVDDPNAMTKMIFDAVLKTGQRALVSKGWGGFGADQIGIPDGVFMLGNVPHDWLFKKVSCVVHHGGAGTTAAGIAAGRPTVVVPFFGDQPFWGAMTAKAGAGPKPVPYKDLTADKLAAAIKEALKPESLERAAELSAKISKEHGAETGAKSFHKQLHLDTLRCHLSPGRAAVWRVKRTDIRLSAFAATVLGNEGLLDFSDLKLYRAREYDTEDGPWEPITGGASALIGTIGNLSMGIADFPIEVLKSLRIVSSEIKSEHEKRKSLHSSTASTAPSTISRASTEMSRASTEATRPSISSEGHSTENETKDAGPQEIAKPETDEAIQEPKSPASPDSAASRGRPGSLAQALKEHGRRLSRSSSRRSSRSGSPATGGPRHDETCPGEVVGHLTLEGAISAAQGVGKIVGAGVKSPMEFSLAIAKGFHNAPKLYGDTTVRPSDKITGVQSGFKAAGKEFGYGIFDGITGLVTQPLSGAKKEGAAGFFKGAAKGVGGLVLKPSAAFWGIPGYTAKGIYAELQKHFGSSVQNYIIAARTAQGYEDWKNSTPEDRTSVISNWKSTQLELHKHGKKYGKEKAEEKAEAFERPSIEPLPSGFSQTRHLSFDERKRIAEEKRWRKKDEKASKKSSRSESMRSKESGGKVKSRCNSCPFHHSESFHHSIAVPDSLRAVDSPHNAEFEDAIQRSVTATSKGNPDEDQMIERALRASVKELQSAQAAGQRTDVAYERAVAASIAEANKVRLGASDKQPAVNVDEVNDDEHDEGLAEAIRQSLAQQHLHDPKSHSHDHSNDDDWSSDSGLGTEDDEAYLNAIEESKRLHTQRKHSHESHRTEKQPPPPLPPRGTSASTSRDDLGGDDDLKRAITESEEQTRNLEKQRTEEEIVMEYVKKQSLLEEELRRKKTGESETDSLKSR